MFSIWWKQIVSFSSRLRGLLLVQVAAVIEVTEKSDEAERVGEHHHVHGVGEVAVSEQVVGGVDGDDEELELWGWRWRDTREK